MPNPPKLSDRTDRAGLISQQIVLDMIRKIYDIKDLRYEVIRDRTKEVNKVKDTFSKKITLLDKDLYNFENAAKLMCGAKEFTRLRVKLHKELLEKKKEDRDNEQSNKEGNQTEMPQMREPVGVQGNEESDSDVQRLHETDQDQ